MSRQKGNKLIKVVTEFILATVIVLLLLVTGAVGMALIEVFGPILIEYYNIFVLWLKSLNV